LLLAQNCQVVIDHFLCLKTSSGVLRTTKYKEDTRVGLLETATWQESNGHVVDPGEYTLLVCHDTRGLGGDQAGAESIKAEEGKCLTHTVTI
jgi:hypothetical protein